MPSGPRDELESASEPAPGHRFRRLPDRIDPQDYVETAAEPPVPSTPDGVNLESYWVLRDN